MYNKCQPLKRLIKNCFILKQLIVNDAIKAIIKNSQLASEKRRDLSGMYVYKFKIHHQEFLLAYEWNTVLRLLLALGVHENFYLDLKGR